MNMRVLMMLMLMMMVVMVVATGNRMLCKPGLLIFDLSKQPVEPLLHAGCIFG
jgi:hypothetical protein